MTLTKNIKSSLLNIKFYINLNLIQRFSWKKSILVVAWNRWIFSILYFRRPWMVRLQQIKIKNDGGSLFDAKLVASRVTPQHIVFFILSYFLYIIIWNRKAKASGLVNDNQDTLLNLTPVWRFSTIVLVIYHDNLIFLIRKHRY